MKLRILPGTVVGFHRKATERGKATTFQAAVVQTAAHGILVVPEQLSNNGLAMIRCREDWRTSSDGGYQYRYNDADGKRQVRDVTQLVLLPSMEEIQGSFSED